MTAPVRRDEARPRAPTIMRSSTSSGGSLPKKVEKRPALSSR